MIIQLAMQMLLYAKQKHPGCKKLQGQLETTKHVIKTLLSIQGQESCRVKRYVSTLLNSLEYIAITYYYVPFSQHVFI